MEIEKRKAPRSKIISDNVNSAPTKLTPLINKNDKEGKFVKLLKKARDGFIDFINTETTFLPM